MSRVLEKDPFVKDLSKTHYCYSIKNFGRGNPPDLGLWVPGHQLLALGWALLSKARMVLLSKTRVVLLSKTRVILLSKTRDLPKVTKLF